MYTQYVGVVKEIMNTRPHHKFDLRILLVMNNITRMSKSIKYKQHTYVDSCDVVCRTYFVSFTYLHIHRALDYVVIME